MWALAGEAQRREIEAAHAAAVSETIRHLTETVPTVRRRYDGQVIEEHARDLMAAEYRHTTSRGVLEGDAPDPQLHSHVVITSAIREDGKIVAVASRPSFAPPASSAPTTARRSRTNSSSAAMGLSGAPANMAATLRSPTCRVACWTPSAPAAARSPEPPSASAHSTVGRPSAASYEH